MSRCNCNKPPWWLVIFVNVLLVATAMSTGFIKETEGRREGYGRGYTEAWANAQKEAAGAGAGYWDIDPVSGEREWKWQNCGMRKGE